MTGNGSSSCAAEACALRFVVLGDAKQDVSALLGRLLHGPTKLLDCEACAVWDADIRYWSLPGAGRRLYVPEAAGIEQTARSMILGATSADAAIIHVHARDNDLIQAKRHAHITALTRVSNVLLALDGTDSEQRFLELEARCRALALEVGLAEVASLPLSSLEGASRSAPNVQMSWREGRTLREWLESLECDNARLRSLPTRFQVRCASRSGAATGGAVGTLASGVLKRNDPVRLQPGGVESRVTRIIDSSGDLDHLVAGQSATLMLSGAAKPQPGDVICASVLPAQVGRQFEAVLIWTSREPMFRGRTYSLTAGAKTVAATILPLKYKICASTRAHLSAEKLDWNEIGVCEVELDRPIAFDPYTENRRTGRFVLRDRADGPIVGVGLLRFALRRDQNIHAQRLDVSKAARAAQKGQRPCVLWMTGLPAAGKSSIANLVEKRLHALGRHTYVLDGDNVRHGLTKDLGFTAEDRVENIRRVAEVAKLMVDAGLIVVAAFISPFRAERRMARSLFEVGEFIEVFVDAPLEVAERRDPKGLYRKARRGDIKNFTGVDSPYEPPESPEIRIDTANLGLEEAAEQILAEMHRMGVLTSATR